MKNQPSALLLNENGYTIIEVIIVSVLLGLFALGTAQMSQQLFSSAKVPDTQVSRDSVGSLIRETLKYKATCREAIVGPQNSSGFESASILSGNKEIQLKVPGINPGSSNNIIGSGTTVGRLQITSLRLVNAVALPGDNFFAQLQMRSEGSNGGMALKSLEVGALFFTATGGAITECENDSTDPTPFCVEMGCSWDPANTPSCQCSPIELDCPPQQFITAIDAGGNPICKPLGAGVSCPANRYLKAMMIGSSICKPLPNPGIVNTTDAYHDALGRDPSIIEIYTTAWPSDYDTVMNTIKSSIQAQQSDRDQIIASAYRNGFGRTASPGEYSYWNSALQSGSIYMDIMFTIRQALVVNSTDRLSTIQNAYQHGLTREPTATEITDWDSQLKSGDITYTDLRKAIQASGGTTFNPYSP